MSPPPDIDALSPAELGLARRIEDHPTGPASPVLFEQSPELLTAWLNAQEYLDAVWSVSQVYTLDILSPQALSEIIRLLAEWSG